MDILYLLLMNKVKIITRKPRHNLQTKHFELKKNVGQQE